MPDPLERKLISFDDPESLEEIRKHVTLQIDQAKLARDQLRKVLADDQDALIQLATLAASARVLHQLLVLALDAHTARLTDQTTGPRPPV